MNRLLYIALYSSLLLAFTACTSDDAVQENKYTVGEADNEIRFSAGVTTGGQSAQSRAALAGHYAMKENTQIRLKVDGNWVNHGDSPYLISKTTTCKANADATNDGTSSETSIVDNINSLGSFNPTLYWDDYGTGDPANSANRANGLNVFGVAVDGETTAPAISGSDTWKSLSWTVNTDGSNVLEKDIICSNNLSDKVTTPCRYTFANRNDNEMRRLDFKHVLSKITFEVTAGTGFTAANGFTSEPTIHLTNNTEWESELSGYTESNYCLYTGNVDIEGAKATANASLKEAIKMEQIAYDATYKKYTYHALVYPGTPLGGTDNNTIIALINADGNVYKVPAEMIRTKMAEITNPDNFTTLAGHNYIIKVTINKQGLNVTAAVTNWVNHEISADAKINITADNYGNNGDNSLEKFDLYLKKTSNSQYEMHGSVTKSGGNYVTGLYWPTTEDTYHLRALIDPVDNSPSLNTDGNYTLFDSDNGYAVTLNRGDAKNDYQWGTTWDGTAGAEHYGADITPTAGNVRLQFKHVMSQVTVIVKTTDNDAAVDLKGSKCVITRLNSTATLNMHTGKVTLPTSGSSDYTVYDFNTDEGKHTQLPDGGGYTSIQIPQGEFSGDGIKFVITLLDGTTYQLSLSDIVLTTGEHAITKWESGGSYTYTLTLKKQEIKVTAQIKEWNELGTASGDIQL